MVRWQDEQFRICRDTFPIETILLVVDFAENYTLQPQNEIQSQYYQWLNLHKITPYNQKMKYKVSIIN